MTPDSLQEPPEELGTASFSSRDNAISEVKWDRIAHDSYNLKLISVVCETQRLKAIRAILHDKSGKARIKAEGLDSTFPSGATDYYNRYPGNLSADEAGYEMYLNKLEYGQCHAVIITRDEDFIRYLSPDSLWERLNSDRFSTPLLKSWMTYLSTQLANKRYLRECRCHRCNCAVLAIPGEYQLDELISEGLKSGEITIPFG